MQFMQFSVNFIPSARQLKEKFAFHRPKFLQLKLRHPRMASRETRKKNSLNGKFSLYCFVMGYVTSHRSLVDAFDKKLQMSLMRLQRDEDERNSLI
jgi:hypothetical protein